MRLDRACPGTALLVTLETAAWTDADVHRAAAVAIASARKKYRVRAGTVPPSLTILDSPTSCLLGAFRSIIWLEQTYYVLYFFFFFFACFYTSLLFEFWELYTFFFCTSHCQKKGKLSMIQGLSKNRKPEGTHTRSIFHFSLFHRDPCFVFMIENLSMRFWRFSILMIENLQWIGDQRVLIYAPYFRPLSSIEMLVYLFWW